MNDCIIVKWEYKVEKQLDKLPLHILKKFYTWVKSVELVGIVAIRKTSGYHDEPLNGPRKGQRSINLYRMYRWNN